MVLTIILTTIALIALVLASYTDLKSREVPDWLSYGLLFSALGLRLIFSFKDGIRGNWNIFFSGLLGFAVLFTVGYIFYRVSQWGGGDAKLLMSMGAIIGITLPFSASSLKVLWYFLALLLMGSIYGLGWMIYLAIKSWKHLSKSMVVKLRKNHYLHLSLIILTIMLIALTFWNRFFWPLALFPLPLFYLFMSIDLVEHFNFYRKISPSKLTEGDWMAEDLIVNGKIILKQKTLEQKDILKLRKFETEKRIEKVLIKDGIPFIPSFLLAYLLFLFGAKLGEVVLSNLF